MDAHQELCRILSEKSLRRGDFVLASGKRSSFYIDARMTTMSGKGQQLIGQLGLQALDAAGWQPRAVGGLTLGADPVSYALAHSAALQNRELDAFTVRKEPKDHGAGRLIEGPLESGWNVVIVEDTVTTGDSALRAVKAVRAAGAEVLGVLVVVDREEGGRERIAESGLSLISLVKVSELL